IDRFSQMPRLRVAPSQRSFRYRGNDVDVQAAARELHAQAILSGKITTRGDMLIVRMTLVDVEQDTQVWGQQFAKKLSDIFVLEEEIANEAMAALKMKLTSEPKKRRATSTANTEAYHLYLKG